MAKIQQKTKRRKIQICKRKAYRQALYL